MYWASGEGEALMVEMADEQGRSSLPDAGMGSDLDGFARDWRTVGSGGIWVVG
jgi:hypothetical protein